MAGRPLRQLRNALRLNQNPRPTFPRGARPAAVDERVLLTLTAARPAALSVFEIVLNSGLMSATGILRPRHPNDPARSVRLDVEASLKRLLRSGDVTERKGSDLLPELTGYAATRPNPLVGWEDTSGLRRLRNMMRQAPLSEEEADEVALFSRYVTLASKRRHLLKEAARYRAEEFEAPRSYHFGDFIFPPEAPPPRRSRHFEAEAQKAEEEMREIWTKASESLRELLRSAY